MPYTAAFGLALASAYGGFFMGYRVVMTGSGYGVAGFFAVTILLPLLVAVAVFIISYAAFSDKWIGWLNSLMAAAFVSVTALVCFTLLTQDVLGDILVAILLFVTLFFGGRFLLKRASLA